MHSELAKEQDNSRKSITNRTFSNPNADSNNPSCLQEIKPNSKKIFTCTAEYNGIQCGAKIHIKENDI